MKWNKKGKKWQESRKGTARAHVYYFITQHGTGSSEWAVGVGYYGFGRQVLMQSAGTFATARQARAYCEKYDATREIIAGQVA